jgi:hypothetical protein
MNGEDEQIPEVIEQRLRHVASGTTVLVPASVDEAVLSRARQRFAEIRRRRARTQRAWWISAAAAVVVLGLLASSLITATRYERADIDHSGNVDILDAFALARRIQEGDTAGFDFNNDGVVDRADVDTVAAQAVRLRKGRA